MKACEKCGAQNPDDAVFCHQCGTAFSAASPSPATETELWRAFIGPNADRYLQQFREFTASGTPRFALTWHWPAFLVDPFLWFLYRKMYVYAFIYAVGPVVSAYATGDFTVGIIWRIMAGVSANYLYFWHVKDHLKEFRTQQGQAGADSDRLLHDLGGVQPYVVWLGVALHALLVAILIMLILEGPPEGGKSPPTSPKPALDRIVL